MPKYFCEYCGIFLTHSSPWGRKQHSHGRKHINNKIEYYSQFIYEFQQNKYQHLMEMATRAGPQINTMLPPRMMHPINPMPAHMQGFPPGMQPMQGMPPMGMQPMQGFPPGMQPIQGMPPQGMQSMQGIPPPGMQPLQGMPPMGMQPIQNGQNSSNPQTNQ